MKRKFHIGDTVYYTKLLRTMDSSEYIVRSGKISNIRVETSSRIVRYQVDTLTAGITFTLSQYELFKTQKEALKSIQ